MIYVSIEKRAIMDMMIEIDENNVEAHLSQS
jgi:hypothetical protein